jgi:similar to stage IV sporulation protein
LVSFVSAQYKGVVLYIKIVETENPPDVIDSTPKDLTASHRGKISKLLVYQGTPLVKAGDTVEKGQVIIGGYRESPDAAVFPCALWVKHTALWSLFTPKYLKG